MIEGIPVTVRGTTYPSRGAAARALGVSASTVQQAVKFGIEDGIGTRRKPGLSVCQKRLSAKAPRGWTLCVPRPSESQILPDASEQMFPALFILTQEAKAAGLTVRDLKGPRRFSQLVKTRDRAIRRMRDELGMSMPEIGRAVGNRDHTTILASLRRTQEIAQ